MTGDTELRLLREEQLREENTRLREVLQSIIDGAVHPETAVRRVMVDLQPIRKVLARQERPGVQ